MSARVTESKECRLCHRIAYAGFRPAGGENWVFECVNDRACNRRRAERPPEPPRTYTAAGLNARSREGLLRIACDELGLELRIGQDNKADLIPLILAEQAS